MFLYFTLFCLLTGVISSLSLLVEMGHRQSFTNSTPCNLEATQAHELILLHYHGEI